MAREHAAGAFEPPGGDGGITAKGEGIPCEPERHAGGPQGIVLVAVETEGALARVEGERGVVEPPRHEAELLESLRRFASGLKVGARLCPGAAVERLDAGGERIDGGHRPG